MTMTTLKKLLLLTIASGAVAFTAACNSAVGCDFRENGPGGAEPRCQERRGFQAQGFDAFCTGIGGDAVEGGCPVEGIIGGCDDGGDITDWYYEPETSETIAEHCTTDDLTQIGPP